MAANTILNLGSGGDTVRDIDLGGGVKAQVMLANDPALVTNIRASYTSAQTDTAIITVGAGNRIAYTNIYVGISADMTVDVLVRIGMGAANTPTTTGVAFTHPKMFAGQDSERGSGAGILGIGADGEDLRITTGTITTGTVDVLVSYMILPTAGI